MVIARSAYEDVLLNIPKSQSETGGILGTTNKIITHIFFDKGIKSDRQCCYIPDTNKLNMIIEEWSNSNIEFAGIFQVHFWNVKSLSCGALEYIHTIMNSMPQEIGKLYFPLIMFPQKDIIPYFAYKKNNNIYIDKEIIKICNSI